MIEAYKIGVSMILDQGRILGPLGEVAQAYERLENSQKNIQGGINQMAAGYRAAAKAARELADAVERVNRAQAGAGGARGAAPGVLTGGAMAGGGLGVGGGSASRSGRIAGGPPALMLAGPGGGGDGSDRPYNVVDLGWKPANAPPEKPKAHDLMLAGAALGVGAYADASFLDKIFKAGLDIGATQSNLLTQGFTPEEVAKSVKTAKETQRGITGSTVGGNLEIVSMLMAMTQDAGAAIRLMPEYSKLAVALNASGHGGAQIGELTAAMTGAELRGVLYSKDKTTGKEVLDEAALGLFLKENLAVSTMTHGRIGPAQLTQFLKSGGISAGMTTNQALFADALPLMIAMGPARAGTALQGFGQQFSSGKMSEAAMNLLAEMNIIIDKSKARKMGMGQFMLLPGAMRQGDVELARDAPATFIMDRLLPQIDKYLVKNFGKTFTSADDRRKTQMEAGAFQQVASRIPGGNEMAETLRNNPLILRDREAFRKSMERDAFATQVANNPRVALEGLDAAVNAFLISLAGPNMKTGTNALSDLTHALNRLNVEIDAHPTAARVLVDVAAGLGVVAAGASAVLLSIAPLVALFKIGKWAATPAAASGEGGAAVAASASAAGMGGLVPLLVPLALSGDTTSRSTYSPAQIKIADALEASELAEYRKTHPGASSSAPITVQNTTIVQLDGRTLQKTLTSSIAKTLRSTVGPVGGDQRAVATPPGAVAQ